jgi:ABC-2 type transport system ATP-binding protein
VDTDTGVIRLPVGDAGPAVMLESTRRLDELSIPLAGFALHRPTLDDVFLSLTGHAAEVGTGAEPSKKGRRGRRERKTS